LNHKNHCPIQILLGILWIFSLLSCEAGGNNKTERQIENTKYLVLIDVASKYVQGMQFKGLEAKKASKLFEDYKDTKIKIIKKAARGEDYTGEQKKLKDIVYQFNCLTVESYLLPLVLDGSEENPYIRDFESKLVKVLIERADSDTILEVNKLKVIYQNY
jgi:hypothetical protein